MCVMSKKVLNNPKVTIVIPVYNGEKYVKYAIDSALAQTYKNLEILVINDGSVDRTDEIVKSYGRKIRYIKKENGGVSSALNLAIKEMRGEYFSWLSHDDTYEPNKIEREIEFLKDNNYLGKKVIVFSDYYLIDKNGNLITEAKKDHEETERYPEFNLLKGNINGLTLLIPKEAFDECGEFDINLSCAQDYEMWWRMMKKGYKFVHMQETLVSTRWHKKQNTQINPKVTEEGNAFYFRVLKNISESKITEVFGSKYNLLIELADFHKDGPYSVFANECRKMAQDILKEASKKTANIKVSVVIPFFNRIEETKRAINSVIKQTHKNIEIVLVNDGSSVNIDDIKKIVKKYNIAFVNNRENAGASVARNSGIKASTGDYIAFLDSDDEFEESKIETQLKYIVASNAKLSHTSYFCKDLKDVHIVHSGKEHGFCARKMMCSCTIATPTVMVDRRWLEMKNIFFNSDFQLGEDVCFWLELLKDGVYLVGIDEPLSVVNVNEKSTSRNDYGQMIGIKNIIRYLINDDYYNRFDLNLSCIMKSYINYVMKNNALFITQEPYAGSNMFQKFMFFAKQEGLISVGKRLYKKMRNILLTK